MRCYCYIWASALGVVPTVEISKGKLVPFGSKVLFKSTTERVRKKKYEGPAIVGVFAGYVITLGYGWLGI